MPIQNIERSFASRVSRLGPRWRNPIGRRMFMPRSCRQLENRPNILDRSPCAISLAHHMRGRFAILDEGMQGLLTAMMALFTGHLLAQSEQRTPIATSLLILQGRIVDADDGTPIPRVRVELSGHQSTGYALAWAREDWVDPDDVQTGADGRFRFAIRLSASDEPVDRGRFHIHARLESLKVPGHEGR